MTEDDLIAMNKRAIMSEYDRWVKTTTYIVPPAVDAWMAGWQAALDRIHEVEINNQGKGALHGLLFTD